MTSFLPSCAVSILDGIRVRTQNDKTFDGRGVSQSGGDEVGGRQEATVTAVSVHLQWHLRDASRAGGLCDLEGGWGWGLTGGR